MRVHWGSFLVGLVAGLLPAIAFIVWLLAMTFAGPARAGQHRGMTLKALIADCQVDARSNPLVLSCPAGCTVTISNGASAAAAPQVQVSAACRALR